MLLSLDKIPVFGKLGTTVASDVGDRVGTTAAADVGDRVGVGVGVDDFVSEHEASVPPSTPVQDHVQAVVPLTLLVLVPTIQL